MTVPNELPYRISGRELVAQVDGMRVQLLTLTENEVIPWHYHSIVQDIFLSLEGTVIIETRVPQSHRELKPGEYMVIEPTVPHEVSSKGKKGCRFFLVQGVGVHDYNAATSDVTLT